jgi:hypothetical protein
MLDDGQRMVIERESIMWPEANGGQGESTGRSAAHAAG